MNEQQPIFSITLTEQEASVLLNLIHEAAKARGIDVVDAASHFKNKISAAHAASKQPSPAKNVEDFITTLKPE